MPRRAPRFLAASALAGAAMLPPQACAMSVQDALTKTRALQKRGMVLAALSPDFPRIKREVLDAGKVWRAQVETVRPPVCAPPSVKFTADDAIGFLERVPPGQRATADAQTAIVAGLNDRYRCH